MAFEDLTGKIFGQLEVISKSNIKGSTGARLWACKCECGKTAYVVGASLKNGYAKSCGCLKSQIQREYRNRQSGIYTLTYSPSGKTTGIGKEEAEFERNESFRECRDELSRYNTYDN